MTETTTGTLQRILGLGFGLALAFGCTIGVGILRLPGVVAAALGDRTLIMLFWALGGVYALMGAVAVTELAVMIPETGGFRVYARRAYGEGVGFAIGWCDWLNNVCAVAYASMTAVTFLGVAVVSDGGTPCVALLLTSLMVVAVILSGSFEQVVAMYAVLFLTTYTSTFLAVFVLRYREPAVARPFKAVGYPFSTAIVLIGSVAFLIAAIVEDLRSGVIAGVFLGACIPVYLWMARDRHRRAGVSAA